MTSVLAGLLVVLLGGRLRLRPRPRPLPMQQPAGVESNRSQWWRRFAQLRPGRPSAEPTPEQIAVWCDDLARAVGSGTTLPMAITTVEPPSTCAAAVASIRLALERGAPLQDSCSSNAHPAALRVALTVIGACAAHGGPAGEPLSRTAAVLRGRAADAAERRTQSAQARLSAVVMTIMPVCMLILLVGSSGSARLFVTTPAGLCVIAVGAALNALGWRWMRRLINGGPQ